MSHPAVCVPENLIIILMFGEEGIHGVVKNPSPKASERYRTGLCTTLINASSGFINTIQYQLLRREDSNYSNAVRGFMLHDQACCLSPQHPDDSG